MFATSGYFVLSSPAWHLASPPFSTARREPHSRATSPPSRPTRKVCTTSATSSSGGGKEADDALHSAAREKLDLSQEIIQIIVSSGPSGVSRTFAAVQACSALGARFLRDPGSPPKPEVLLRELFEALGATYVKLGQFVASSPTLFPKEYVNEFQKCFDRTPAVPFNTIREIITADLSKPVDAVFESIDPVPLASASVAQVHAAVLLGSRKNVIVKVLKPDVTETLSTDLSFIYVASRVLTFLNPEIARLSLVDIVRDIRTSMLEEVDFIKEAKNVAAFQRYLDAAGITDAVAPYVYINASSSKVLTMERIYGTPLTDLDAIRSVTAKSASGLDTQGSDGAERLLITALNTWFGSVLACESFHADVHAGNLLVTREGRVAFIDFGIVGRISPSVLGAIQIFFRATAAKDYERMAKALVQMGAAETDVDTDKFAEDLRRVYDAIHKLESDVVLTNSATGEGVSATMAIDQQQVSQLVFDITRVGDENGIKFPSEFGLLLKQILYFDRYVRLLAPDVEVVSEERVSFMNSAILLSGKVSNPDHERF